MSHWTWKYWWNKDTIGVAVAIPCIILLAWVISILFFDKPVTKLASISIIVSAIIVCYLVVDRSDSSWKFVAALAVAVFMGISLMGCATHTPSISFGVGYQIDKQTVGDNPAGVVSLKMPIWTSERCVNYSYIYGEYLHISSVPNFFDKSTVDQANLMFSIPLR